MTRRWTLKTRMLWSELSYKEQSRNSAGEISMKRELSLKDTVRPKLDKGQRK